MIYNINNLCNVIYYMLKFFTDLVNSLQSYNFEDRSHVNIISTMREAKNYLSKLNSIDFGPTVEPKATLKYLENFCMPI